MRKGKLAYTQTNRYVGGMAHLPTAEDIADQARAAGLSLVEMCRRADTAYTTYYRWRKGYAGPSISIVERWLKEIEKAAKSA